MNEKKEFLIYLSIQKHLLNYSILNHPVYSTLPVPVAMLYIPFERKAPAVTTKKSGIATEVTYAFLRGGEKKDVCVSTREPSARRSGNFKRKNVKKKRLTLEPYEYICLLACSSGQPIEYP